MMISYRDMTFCPFWRKCARGGECGRAMTNDVAERTRKAGMRVSQFCEPPACMEARPKHTIRDEGTDDDDIA